MARILPLTYSLILGHSLSLSGLQFFCVRNGRGTCTAPWGSFRLYHFVVGLYTLSRWV